MTALESFWLSGLKAGDRLRKSEKIRDIRDKIPTGINGFNPDKSL